MKHKLDFVNSKLESIKEQNLYRQLKNSKIKNSHIIINKKSLLNFSSNDYLGLSSHKSAKNFQSSSRLVSGNDESFQVLEKKLAKHKSQHESLIFPTGYMANIGVITTLIQKNDIILSDKLNHASIIDACKMSNGKTIVYKHNDLSDLEIKLRKKNGRKFIITEGVFSMDGDFADLKNIAKIAESNNAILILDDAHGDFVFGSDGKGTPNHFGVSKKIDVYVSSLSKGLGSFGGYIAGQKNIIELTVNKAKSFIYTSALPAPIVDITIQRFESDREKNRKKLLKNIKTFHDGLHEIGLDIKSKSHIIPIIVGKEKDAVSFSNYLFKNGIFAQAIRYPTVPKDQARIRMSLTAKLEKKQILSCLAILEKSLKKFNVI